MKKDFEFKLGLLWGLFFILVLSLCLNLGLVNAKLCKGCDGYYHDCENSYYTEERGYYYVNEKEYEYHDYGYYLGYKGHENTNYNSKNNNVRCDKYGNCEKYYEQGRRDGYDKAIEDREYKYDVTTRLEYYPYYAKLHQTTNFGDGKNSGVYYGDGYAVVVDEKDYSYWRYKEDYRTEDYEDAGYNDYYYKPRYSSKQDNYNWIW